MDDFNKRERVLFHKFSVKISYLTGFQTGLLRLT